MAEKRDITHPLSRRQFYAECLRYATTGAWGVTGDLSTGVPLAVLVFKMITPHWYAIAAHFLQSYRVSDDWLFLAPAAVGGLILIGRIVTAPFVLYRDKPSVAGAPHAPLTIAATLPAYDLQIQELHDEDTALHTALRELKSDNDAMRAELAALTAQTAQFATHTARQNATLRNRAWALAAELRNIKNKVEVNVPEIALDVPELPADAPLGHRGPHAMWRIMRSSRLSYERYREIDRQCKEIYSKEFVWRVDTLKDELQQAGISLPESSTGAFFWNYIADMANALASAAERLS